MFIVCSQCDVKYILFYFEYLFNDYNCIKASRILQIFKVKSLRQSDA